MDAAAITGTFVKVNGTLADGTLRLVIDIEPRHAQDAFALFHEPGTEVVLARLNLKAEAAPEQQQEEPKEKPGQLCVMACKFCADPQFQKWLGVYDEEEAKAMILEDCGIASRKDLDSNHEAAQKFLNDFRGPFMAYRASANKPRSA